MDTDDKFLDLNLRRHQPGLEPAASHPYPGIELRATAGPSHSAEVSSPQPVYDYYSQQQQRHWPPAENELPTSADDNNITGNIPTSNNRRHPSCATAICLKQQQQQQRGGGGVAGVDAHGLTFRTEVVGGSDTGNAGVCD